MTKVQLTQLLVQIQVEKSNLEKELELLTESIKEKNRKLNETYTKWRREKKNLKQQLIYWKNKQLRSKKQSQKPSDSTLTSITPAVASQMISNLQHLYSIIPQNSPLRKSIFYFLFTGFTQSICSLLGFGKKYFWKVQQDQGHALLNIRYISFIV